MVRDHHCATSNNLGFRKHFCRQYVFVFEDLGQGLADAEELEGIIPFLGQQCLGEDIRNLLHFFNILNADTATRRQLFRDTAHIHFVGPANISELWGISLYGSLIVPVQTSSRSSRSRRIDQRNRAGRPS